MERKSIFFLKPEPLNFEEFIYELSLIYKSLNKSNLAFIREKYILYLNLNKKKFQTKEITLPARFDLCLFGFKKN